jgi:iron complex transport system ATP-binding protein
MLLDVTGIRAGYYPENPVLDDVDLRLSAGGFLGLIGPNGSGKSTLLRVLAGVLTPWAGQVCLDGANVLDLSRRQLARTIAVVPQEILSPFAFTAGEIVAMGRHPYLPRFGGLGAEDMSAVTDAMERTGTAQLASRSILELSGGERQRVVIARALAQQPRLLLLDEPTNHLDINHQVEVLDLLYDLNRNDGLAIVCVTHDLNAAAEYTDHVVLMAPGGRAHAAGPPGDVITADHVEAVYGIRVAVIDTAGRPRITPWSRRHPQMPVPETIPVAPETCP